MNLTLTNTYVTTKEKTSKIRDIISEIEVDYDFKYNLPISTVVYSLFEYKTNMEVRSFFFESVEKEGVII